MTVLFGVNPSNRDGQLRPPSATASNNPLELLSAVAEQLGEADERAVAPDRFTRASHPEEANPAEANSPARQQPVTPRRVNNALIDAIEHKDFQAISYLLQRYNLSKAQVEEAALLAISQAGRGTDPQMNTVVEQLLNHSEMDVNLTGRNNQPEVVLAAYNNKNARLLVGLLNKPELNLNSRKFAWDKAVVNNLTDLIEYMLDHPAITPSIVNSPLGEGFRAHHGSSGWVSAMGQGNFQLAKLLAKHPKFDINAPLSPGTCLTPLGGAAVRNSEEVVRVLLAENRLRLDQPAGAPQSDTTIFAAAGAGRLRMLQTLLARPGFNINAINPEGVSALDNAFNNGRADVVHWMLPRVHDTVLLRAGGPQAREHLMGWLWSEFQRLAQGRPPQSPPPHQGRPPQGPPPPPQGPPPLDPV
ncbi:ankyrin repeat domain-containing protein [Vampirovibrio sp.]|uniref:ankyrin repeat domain-containing protein n=1 Tax=Vampirovibrio sp. TaxID=2717857 RepID=UPI0035947550